MPFSLSLIDRDAAGIAHLAARGDATAADFPYAQQSLFEPLLGPKWAAARVLLNMDDVPYLDSSAIGWLIGMQKQFRAAGGMLVLHSVQTPVRNVLSLLKIERVVPIAADADAARALAAGAGRQPV